MGPEVASNPTLASVGRTLLLDAAAVACISALREEGIRAILLKGPVTAAWLYSDDAFRDYTDIDLLVSPEEFERAARTLERLGYRDKLTDRLPNEVPPHAREFRLERSSLASGATRLPAGLWIDLHWSFQGINAPAQEFWALVAESTETMPISRTEVEVPSDPIRALLLALHAARSGAEVGQPLVDLDRGLERVDVDTWSAAHTLAVRLDAAPRFLAGLAMRPRGVELIDRLDLRGKIDMPSALFAAGIPPVAAGLERLRTTTGLRRRLALLARELVPTVSFMRAWSPLARRGAIGLTLAYAFRPFWLLVKLPGALRAYARAQRLVETGNPSDSSPDRSAADHQPGSSGTL